VSHTCTIVSHTHWDREWYQPFEEFRIRLVKLVDKLLDILTSDPDYRYFTLDGQTIILEDYLEIRPQKEEEIRRLVQQGRLLIGPWWILPDEFLVSPEATIRNLMLGDQVAKRFGAKMEVGYLPDPFGHIGQMPQILAGFGIDVAVLRRGLSDEPTELIWQAPDGSSVLLIYLRDGYGNAAHLPLNDDAAFLEAIVRLKDSLTPHGATTNLLLMNGTDHMEPQPELPAAMARANQQLEDARLIHSTLPLYIEAVRQANPELETISGELRSPKRHPLLPGVLSTRMWIKQRNAYCETLLEKWAEPFSAFAHLNLQPFIHQAWRYLIQNHPHDSICGCSVDQVHKEMEVRFDWVEQIGEEVTRQSLATIASEVSTAELEQRGLMGLVVFNPVAGPRTDIVTAEVQLPGGFEDFTIVDSEGREVPHQVLGQRNAELAFVAQQVPRYGYKTYLIKAGHQHPTSNLQHPASSIENEFFLLEANTTDGTLTVTDKLTGAVFPDLNCFVDGGDRGDEYTYCRPENDSVVNRPAAAPTIGVIEAGPARRTLEIGLTYQLPVSLAEDRFARSKETVEVPIKTRVSLYPGVRRIDFTTTVENHARDHRLRVHFPTPIQTDCSNAEGHFDIVQRPLDLPQDTAGWIEQPAPTHPQRTFVDVNDREVGLMVINKGLPEYEVVKGKTGGVTVALTLLRGVGWLSRDDLHSRRGHAGPAVETPGAQCLGKQTFEYAIVPHAGSWEACFEQAHAFNAPLRAVPIHIHSGQLPPQLSFVQIEPASLVISAIKQAEDEEGLIVRFYNISAEEAKGRLKMYRPFVKATSVNLNEGEIAELKSDEREVELSVRGKQIVTVKFERSGAHRPHSEPTGF